MLITLSQLPPSDVLTCAVTSIALEVLICTAADTGSPVDISATEDVEEDIVPVTVRLNVNEEDWCTPSEMVTSA